MSCWPDFHNKPSILMYSLWFMIQPQGSTKRFPNTRRKKASNEMQSNVEKKNERSREWAWERMSSKTETSMPMKTNLESGYLETRRVQRLVISIALLIKFKYVWIFLFCLVLSVIIFRLRIVSIKNENFFSFLIASPDRRDTGKVSRQG